MTDPVRVLLVEDSSDDAMLIERALVGGGLQPRVTRVETRAAMEDALADPWDVVIADYRLPSFDVWQALEVIEERGLDLPFLVVTGTIGEEEAARLLRAGAHDFLLKESLGRLVPAIEREMREAEMRRQHRTAEAELVRARSRYRALVESAADVVYIVDARGRVMFSSPASRDLVGMEPDEVVGLDAFQFVHPEDRPRIQQELRDVVQRGERRRAEYRIIRADGAVRYVESVATNLMGDPSVDGIVVNTRDLTERKELQDQLHHAQKMEAIGRLVGGVAHDFNNLVTVISGNTRLLLDALDEGAEEREDAEQVLAAADRAAALTRQLLAFSKFQPLSPRVVSVGTTVEGLRSLLQRLIGEDIRLSVSVESDDLRVRIDPVQLEQVLMNLAVNAREAMPRGGDVNIRVEGVHASRLPRQPALGPRPGWVRIVVQDSGPGIPEEIRTRIFDPFFTTKEKGTGLGLSTVYGIVAQSQGQIEVSCPSSGGTVFSVFLPRVSRRTAEDAPEPATSATNGDRPRSERILLVEDNADVRRVTRRVLERDGFEVVEATAGKEALELLDRPDGFDLVITDLVMAEMSGTLLAQRIGEMLPDLPILYMSGFSEHEVPSLENQATTRAFLGKPFTPGELTGVVRRLIGGKAR